MKLRLIILNFLEFAVWGAYLTSQGRYLGQYGLGEYIGWFFSVQGLVSIFMPALTGIIADKWVPAQKMLSLCHLIAAATMLGAGLYGMQAGDDLAFAPIFTLYTISVAFFMPTIALANSVAYNALEKEGLDTVKAFPPIRIWGTIGFILAMWFVDLTGYQNGPEQYIVSGILGVVMAFYSWTMPDCPLAAKNSEKTSIVEAMGLKAFTLFKDRQLAVFFIFSFLLGSCLQISNGFANTYLSDFGGIAEYKGTFGVEHSNMLISLSQISETFCILMIPFFLSKFGIKAVMQMAMLAWVLRFYFLGLGNPGSGTWLFVLSMIVYGVAFDFFNISGSLYVDKNTDKSIRSSAQGLFMLMTNGLGAAIGSLAAQAVVTWCTGNLDGIEKMAGWTSVWNLFGGYALLVCGLFTIMFKEKRTKESA